ncbi:hypothetical protein STRATTON_231 [Erwinia phage vB_EamM_Stratton]|uniref:Uncharacterized protein n=2 Tax=Erskinevirus EaH2 TaxID=2169883 RepID=A0A1B2IHB2_9CAUD|nr:hypothetical protein G173_gp131 [Erwinia phage phiEaH2]AFQ96676.1 hypothetical protein [Erwinia phage phiEaH2]ANZ50656.1 hypothetical protein STRATTON_231 [Erwinia phage vB_EamM_Stratton]
MIHAEMKELIQNNLDAGLVLYVVHPELKQEWLQGQMTDLRWAVLDTDGRTSITDMGRMLRQTALEANKLVQVRTTQNEPHIRFANEADVVVLVGFAEENVPFFGENVIISKFRTVQEIPRKVFPI